MFSFIAFQALIAVQPQAQMKYFNVEDKTWKPLAIPPIEATQCYCAVSVGSGLLVAAYDRRILQYDTERNVWETLSNSCSLANHFCVIQDDHGMSWDVMGCHGVSWDGHVRSMKNLLKT